MTHQCNAASISKVAEQEGAYMVLSLGAVGKPAAARLCLRVALSLDVNDDLPLRDEVLILLLLRSPLLCPNRGRTHHQPVIGEAGSGACDVRPWCDATSKPTLTPWMIWSSSTWRAPWSSTTWSPLWTVRTTWSGRRVWSTRRPRAPPPQATTRIPACAVSPCSPPWPGNAFVKQKYANLCN
jgi:hypothetical protein